MKYWVVRFIFSVGVSLLVSNGFAATSDMQAANQSFATFAEMASLNNKKIAHLYADDAYIESIIMKDLQLVDARLVTGREYKKHLDTKSRLLNGGSEFHEVDFFTNGPRIGFFGKRYSRNQCFEDAQYFVIFERQANGQYLIVRERVEQANQGLCSEYDERFNEQVSPNFNAAAHTFEETTPFVAKKTIEKIARKLEANPPLSIDTNTEFLDVEQKDAAINYLHRLKAYQSNPNYNGLLMHVTKAAVVRKTCEHDKLFQVLNYKGAVNYNYVDKHNAEIFSIDVSLHDCQKLAQSLK